MLYLYDRAICQDLKESLNPDNIKNPVVTVLSNDESQAFSVAAQTQDDRLKFPIICVMRSDDIQLDPDRYNFTTLHRGVANVFDTETNNLYHEKAVPIKLSYTMCIYTTNQADQDELLRELIFKYTSQYFLTIKLPYESDRKARFGIRIDPDMDISRKSGSSHLLANGTLYEADLHLNIDGAMMYHYTPVRLRNFHYDVDIDR